MKRLDKLRPGQTPTAKQYNELIDAVESLRVVRGFNGIEARHTNRGTIIGGSSQLIEPRQSFVKTTPGATSAVEVFLDTDSTSALNVTVQCELIGTSALNTATPRLEDGVMVPIWKKNGVWRPFFPFQGTTNC